MLQVANISLVAIVFHEPSTVSRSIGQPPAPIDCFVLPCARLLAALMVGGKMVGRSSCRQKRLRTSQVPNASDSDEAEMSRVRWSDVVSDVVHDSQGFHPGQVLRLTGRGASTMGGVWM